MASAHEGHDHPATKAARAACRRAALTPGTAGPSRPAKDKPSKLPGEKPRERAKRKADDERDHDDQRADGRIGESRLARARAACDHSADKWLLKGATKRKTGTYYCACGQRMGDEGPRDLQAKFRF